MDTPRPLTSQNSVCEGLLAPLRSLSPMARSGTAENIRVESRHFLYPLAVRRLAFPASSIASPLPDPSRGRISTVPVPGARRVQPREEDAMPEKLPPHKTDRPQRLFKLAAQALKVAMLAACLIKELLRIRW